MNLDEYMRKNKMNAVEFASFAGVSVFSVHNWKAGARPSRIYVKHLEDITNGDIKESDWAEYCRAKQARKCKSSKPKD